MPNHIKNPNTFYIHQQAVEYSSWYTLMHWPHRLTFSTHDHHTRQVSISTTHAYLQRANHSARTPDQLHNHRAKGINMGGAICVSYSRSVRSNINGFYVCRVVWCSVYRSILVWWCVYTNILLRGAAWTLSYGLFIRYRVLKQGVYIEVEPLGIKMFPQTQWQVSYQFTKWFYT